jgi:dynactin 1
MGPMWNLLMISQSPTKSPTKEMASAATSGKPSGTARPSLGGSKARPSTGNRMSMGPPALPASANRTSRPSLAPSSRPNLAPSSRPPPPAASNGHSNRLSLKPTSMTRPLSDQASDHSDGHTPLKRQEEDDEDEEPALLSPPLVEDDRQTGASRLLSQSPEATRSIMSHKSDQRPGISPTLTQKSFGNSAVNREVENLKSKLRVMEKKRMEDREKLKDLERTQMERDKFEGIIQKLQTKYQPQQQELADLRKQLKDAEAKLDAVERQEGEHESALEMATLDREMAEETAEAYKTELDSLKMRAEELELEVEVLREENQELGQTMSPEEKSTQGWLQMERTNERLREALLRLRDLTQQTEGDLKAQIKELEDDLEELGGVKKEYEVVSHKFQQSEANLEDLRQQLDTALGAEEMIEELTERNMEYQEQVDNLKAAIEDLESLKELNDELELNHVEAEKQLQEEIDYRENLFSEQSRKVNQQDEVIVDLEYTLSRFRELVINLQSDLEDMRASQQISETEATELTSKSRAMIDLNMKLQASAARAQVKTIDMELRRLEAQEAADHLAMVQLFLPETFSSERDPILALLRFKRIGFKANLLQGVVRERLNDPASGQENMFAAYDVVEKLTWISSTCNRFVNSIGGCDVDAFAQLEGALYELEPVERGLNSWIEGLKRNELNEKQCGVELQRYELTSPSKHLNGPTNILLGQSHCYRISLRRVCHQVSNPSQMTYTCERFSFKYTSRIRLPV